MYHIIEEINEIFDYLNTLPDDVTGEDDIEDHRQNDVHVEPQEPEEHGNQKHEKDYITEGEVDGGAPSPHGNAHHDPEFSEEGHSHDEHADDPHGNESHNSTFAVDGDAQPPESHGNEAHKENYLPEVPSEIDISKVIADTLETDKVNLGLPHGSLADTWVIGRDEDGDLEITDSGGSVLHLNQTGQGTNKNIEVNRGIKFGAYTVYRNIDDSNLRFEYVTGDILMELTSDGDLKVAGTIEENANL